MQDTGTDALISTVVVVFIVAYAAIALEHPLRINKSASALVGAGVLWTIYAALGGDQELIGNQLDESVTTTAKIVFFLIGAMTIVEVIDAHNGFEVITSLIRTRSQVTLMWIVCFVTFFLSAVLDNLTTTIVMNSWPDGGNTPFAGEKGLGKEGAFRVPVVVRWPGRIPAGSSTGEFMTMEDWMPTIMAGVGESGVKDKLLTGYKAGSSTYKVHLDGYDQTDLITGKGPSQRKEFFYFTEAKLHGVRYGDWKFLFIKQDKWFNGVQQSMTTPLVTNLKLDPFERFHEARGFDEWQENRAWTIPPAMDQVGMLLKSLKEFPPRQASVEFNIDEAMKSVTPQGSK